MSDASAGASLKLAFRIVGATSAGASVFRTVVPQPRQQLLKNRSDGLVDRLLICMHDDLRVVRRFVGSIDSGELANFSGPRFLVEVLGIARFANLQGRVNKALDKLGL